MALQIDLLGSVRLRGASGEEVTVGSAHARVALAMLTLQRHRGVSRDVLAETLWPGGLPPTWASALRSIVSRVRSHVSDALGADHDDLLTAEGGRYVLRLPADAVVDVERAADLVARAGEALASGDADRARELATAATRPLAADFLPDHDSDWALGQRERLAELLVSGLEVQSLAAGAAGDAGDALASAMAAVEAAPLRESAHRSLMAAHAAAGNRSEALRVYERLRRLLADELGVDPDLETEAAHLALLGPAPEVGAGDEPLGRPPALAPEVPVVGREAELAAVTAAWSQALRGDAPLVVITGGPGLGKTRLAREVAGRAVADGARVLLGRCDERATVPYQPIVELLDPLLAATPADDLAALPPAARAELAAVFPGASALGDPGPARNRLALFDGVSQLVRSAALDHPLLVILDDLQWVDDDSAELLRHVARDCEGQRLLLLALVRSGTAPDRPVSRLIRTARRDGRLLRVPLHGLDQVAVRRLVHEILPGHDEVAAAVPRLVDESSGNPFVLLEELRALTRESEPAHDPVERSDPSSRSGAGETEELDEFVAAQLAGLSATARTLLVGAAVLGREFDLATVAYAAGLDTDDAADDLDEARAARLVVDAPGSDTHQQYRFTHDLLRRRLYARLAAGRRQRWHGRLADALEDRHDQVDVALVARHRCAAAEPGGDVRAVQWALAAAREAGANGAVSDAVDWCERARGHVAPGDAALESEVLTELGLARMHRGDPEGASILFDGALRARRSGRVDVAARAALVLAEMAGERPELEDDARALLDEVLDEGSSIRPADATRVHRRSWAQLIARRVGLAGSSAEEGDTRLTTAMAVLRRELNAVQGPGELALRTRLADDLRTTAARAGDRDSLVVAAHHRAMSAATAGDDRTLLDALQVIRATAATGISDSLARSVELLVAEREVVEAVTEGRFGSVTVPPAGAWLPSELGPPEPGAMADHQLVVADWLVGRLDGVPAGDPAAGSERSGLLQAETALAQLARGARGRAHMGVRELLGGGALDPGADEWLHTVGLLGFAAVEIGDPQLATDVADLLTPYASLTCGTGYRTFVGTASYHLGRLAAVAERWSDAEAHLTTALRQLAGGRGRPWIALTQHALAEVLQGRGRSSDRESIVALRSEAAHVTTELGLRLG